MPGRNERRRRGNRRQLIAASNQPRVHLSHHQTHAYLNASIYTGPILPAAEELKAFDAVIPQGAERIFDWVRSQSDNRMQMERAVVFSNISKESRGQWMAFLLSFVVIVIGGAIVLTGKDGRGYALIIGPLVWLAGTFITSRMRGRRELQRKKDELAKSGVVESD
jgi:uncharacterized membrane protein